MASPRIFRLWAAISLIGAVGQRKVWTTTKQGRVYPNLYVLLCGRPGVGKTEIFRRVQSAIRETDVAKLSPDDMTKASLIDYLALPEVRVTHQDDSAGRITEQYHSVFIASHELGVLLQDYDLTFMSTLQSLYDNIESYSERKRGFKDAPINIPHPQLSMLMGTTPGHLAHTFPAEAWTQGFMARTLIVYADAPPTIDLFGDGEPGGPEKLSDRALQGLRNIAALKGPYKWAPEARDAIVEWVNASCPPIPSHSRLVNYNTRRHLQALKLSVISAMANRRKGNIIELEDFQNAKGWLLEIERYMPMVFSEMSGTSENTLVEELWQFAMAQYNTKGKRPIHKAKLYHFLHNKAAPYQIAQVIQICEESNILQRMVGTELYIPMPRHVHGEQDDDEEPVF